MGAADHHPHPLITSQSMKGGDPMSRRAIALFCVLTYALSWAIQFWVVTKMGGPENAAAKPFLIAVMFTPTFAVLLFAVFSRTARASIRWKPTWRMIPLMAVAFIVPTLVAFATVATMELAGWGKSGWFLFSSHGVAISGGPWLLGRGVQDWWVFAANVLLTGGYFAVFNASVAVGEEFGWRGFLQGHLVERLGVTRGLVLLGLIWSFWHLPSLLAGYNYPEHPLLGAFVMFPVTLIGASLFMGWLTIRSGSFWPAALAHGATNSIEEGVVSNIHMASPQLFEDLTRTAFTVAFGLLFWALLRRSGERLAVASQLDLPRASVNA
jgi:uncharacterized protein